MKIKEFMVENFQTVSINGILYSLNTDEKKIYSKVKEAGKLLKSELNEFDQRIASNMVTKGLLCRRKNPQHEIYFTTKGRRKCAINKPVEEVAPPDSQIEKWINDNKERFQDRYGKDYKKYLYGKAWNKFNGKKITESKQISKYSKGQKLYNINTQEECTITDIHFEPGLGFFYTVEFDKGYNEDHIHQTLSFNVSEKHLNEEYSENLDYWDGEDE